MYQLKGKRVWVAGHRGMVGQALTKRLDREGCELVIGGRDQVDLSRQSEVEDWMAANRPQAIFLAAAKVGGIHANNTYPADFIYENLVIESNVIHAAHRAGAEKLLFIASSCIYPREAPQPMPEDALLTGPLEPTNEWYAVAKLAGIKLCQAYRRQHDRDFISVLPTNLYGPNDNFDLETSHVLSALMVKLHNAKQNGDAEVEIWGTGTPTREFLHVDDLADALVFLMTNYSDPMPINVGTGVEISIRELAETIARVVGFDGGFRYNTDKPDGMPRKLMDVSALAAIGWRAGTDFETGLREAYAWFLANHVNQSEARAAIG